MAVVMVTGHCDDVMNRLLTRLNFSADAYDWYASGVVSLAVAHINAIGT